MKKFNVAIIGCGTICNSAHAPNYAKNPRAEVKYLVDILPEKAEAVKAKHNLTSAKVITNYKDILSDPDLDLVSVCLPNYLHAPVSIDFLNAGKNVLCEKPVSVSVENALKMQEVAKKSGKILNIGVVNRFNTYVNELKNVIDSGDLGEIYHINCSFRSHRSIPGMGGWFTTKALSGGGVLIDWGVHFVDLILYIIGNPDLVSVSGKAFCELGKDMPEDVFESMWAGPPNYEGVYDVDDSVTGFIRTKGPTITLNGAWAQNITEGTMTVEFLGSKGGAKLRYGSSYDLTIQKDGKITTTTPEFPWTDMFYDEIDSFMTSVETGVKTRANIDNVIITQRVLNGIYDSSDANKEIQF
jgi:predicted dehydrogenase